MGVLFEFREYNNPENSQFSRLILKCLSDLGIVYIRYESFTRICLHNVVDWLVRILEKGLALGFRSSIPTKILILKGIRSL